MTDILRIMHTLMAAVIATTSMENSAVTAPRIQELHHTRIIPILRHVKMRMRHRHHTEYTKHKHLKHHTNRTHHTNHMRPAARLLITQHTTSMQGTPSKCSRASSGSHSC